MTTGTKGGTTMEAFSAQGTCEQCGSFTRAVAATKDDAMLFLNHEHGIDHGHAFEGVPSVRPTTHAEFVSRGTPRQVRR